MTFSDVYRLFEPLKASLGPISRTVPYTCLRLQIWIRRSSIRPNPFCSL